jgi:hypothetical protein
MVTPGLWCLPGSQTAEPLRFPGLRGNAGVRQRNGYLEPLRIMENTNVTLPIVAGTAPSGHPITARGRIIPHLCGVSAGQRHRRPISN